eukprot:SM000001S04547  [mRNA]  locus=s1:818425:822515:- [translate_table: standard]
MAVVRGADTGPGDGGGGGGGGLVKRTLLTFSGAMAVAKSGRHAKGGGDGAHYRSSPKAHDLPDRRSRRMWLLAAVALGLLGSGLIFAQSRREDAIAQDRDSVLFAAGRTRATTRPTRSWAFGVRRPLEAVGEAMTSKSRRQRKEEPDPFAGVLTKPASCDVASAALKVYMYDLPGEFNFGMLQKEYINRLPVNASDIPRYPGAMYQQHSPEYWLTVDVLTSDMEERRNPCVAVRLPDPEQADILLVPFFASLAYNRYTTAPGNRTTMAQPANVTSGGTNEIVPLDRNEELQLKLVKYLNSTATWHLYEGQDHLLVIHHPNSMHIVREQLGAAMFVVADFGRYNESVANMEKDVVAPYKHVIGTFKEDYNGYQDRHLLLFFQGAIVRKEGGVIRQRLYDLLKNETGVQFSTGNTQRTGIRSATSGMRSSKFCLHLAGDTPSSNRLFDAIVSHCVPVIISDDIELPFEDFLDYSEFCVFVRAEDAVRPGHLVQLLRGIDGEEWTTFWNRLKQVEQHFEYRFPSWPGDATQMTWRAIANKIPALKLSLHKQLRYRKSEEVIMQYPREEPASAPAEQGAVLVAGADHAGQLASTPASEPAPQEEIHPGEAEGLLRDLGPVAADLRPAEQEVVAANGDNHLNSRSSHKPSQAAASVERLSVEVADEQDRRTEVPSMADEVREEGIGNIGKLDELLEDEDAALQGVSWRQRMRRPARDTHERRARRSSTVPVIPT